MLEVIGAGNPDYRGKDWADVWSSSPEHQSRTEEIEAMIESRRKEDTISSAYDEPEFAMPLWTQILATSKRTFTAYWRTPNYVIVCRSPSASLLLV